MLVLHKNFHVVSIAISEALQPFLYPSVLSCFCCLQIFIMSVSVTLQLPLLCSPSLNIIPESICHST